MQYLYPANWVLVVHGLDPEGFSHPHTQQRSHGAMEPTLSLTLKSFFVILCQLPMPFPSRDYTNSLQAQSYLHPSWSITSVLARIGFPWMASFFSLLPSVSEWGRIVGSRENLSARGMGKQTADSNWPYETPWLAHFLFLCMTIPLNIKALGQ